MEATCCSPFAHCTALALASPVVSLATCHQQPRSHFSAAAYLEEPGDIEGAFHAVHGEEAVADERLRAWAKHAWHSIWAQRARVWDSVGTAHVQCRN